MIFEEKKHFSEIIQIVFLSLTQTTIQKIKIEIRYVARFLCLKVVYLLLKAKFGLFHH